MANFKTKRNIVLVLIIVPFAFIAILIASFYINRPARVANIEAAADKFTPFGSWKLTIKQHNEPGVCLDTICPESKRWWHSDNQVHSIEDLGKIAMVDGHAMKITEDGCLDGKESSCTAELILDNYSYELSYRYGTITEPGSNIVLTVHEHND